MFGEADGWFDDPIGLSARAYILVPPIALGKFLLARRNLIPWIKLLSDPRAYASSPHWLLLSITKPHSHAPLRYISNPAVMDMVIFRTIFFELLVFFTFTLLILHFAC